MSERIDYFDILRALAICGVVAIHASGTGLNFQTDSINFNFTVLWRNLLNVSVPMFLAISGFFLARKSFNSVSDYLSFLKKQIPRVYIPMLIWSLAWLGLAIVIYQQSLLDEVLKLLTFQSTGPYYFIALILQFYLLLPLLRRWANGRGLVASIVVSLLMTVLIFYLRYFTGLELPLIVYAGNFFTWLMFFVLGLYLGTTDNLKLANKQLIPLIVFFYVLSCIESYLLIAVFEQPGDAVSAVKASSFMYAFFLIIFLFKNRNWIQSSLLKQLGDMSFGIYLIHLFALQAAVSLIARLYPPLQAISPVYQMSLILLVLLSCYLGISFSNRLFSIKQSRLLGFR